jgi:UDP-N-acetylglucosamine 4,6-dehydratase/5-epimerase
MNLMITGGTGTIGREIVKQLRGTDRFEKIIIYSRDESKHADMQRKFPEGGESGLRYFIGDICDYDRLVFAMKDADMVIHAAAMKHIDKCEYNPFESLRVNIVGGSNVVKAAIQTKVLNCMLISTDKACNPVSAYGSQKFCLERLFIGSNNMSDETKFNVVRYGNVIASRGSVFHTWEKLAKQGETLELTHKDMTRFFWSIKDAANFVIKTTKESYIHGDRGCIYIPKIGSKSMYDVAKAYSDNIRITTFRCPEKIHEELISEYESHYTYDVGDYYIIYPTMHDWAKSITVQGEKIKSRDLFISKR